MSQARAVPGFPRGALLSAGVLVLFAILAAGYGRVSGAHEIMPPAATVAERSLRFLDKSDGSVLVSDARDNRDVAVLAPGSNAFVRATMRGLAQQRMREGSGAQAPFDLVALSDGRLILSDPTNQRHIDLEAFGQVNARAFASLLVGREISR